MARVPGRSRKSKDTAPETRGDGGAPRAFETALARSLPGEPFSERVRRAAGTCAGELLFALPAPGGRTHALVRLPAANGGTLLLQVQADADGAARVAVEDEIDSALLGFARASIAVMEHLKADARVVAPLSAAAT
jgi:hypothetical protein